VAAALAGLRAALVGRLRIAHRRAHGCGDLVVGGPELPLDEVSVVPWIEDVGLVILAGKGLDGGDWPTEEVLDLLSSRKLATNGARRSFGLHLGA
jgi:hypothetical protein